MFILSDEVQSSYLILRWMQTNRYYYYLFRITAENDVVIEGNIFHYLELFHNQTQYYKHKFSGNEIFCINAKTMDEVWIKNSTKKNISNALGRIDIPENIEDEEIYQRMINFLESPANP